MRLPELFKLGFVGHHFTIKLIPCTAQCAKCRGIGVAWVSPKTGAFLTPGTAKVRGRASSSPHVRQAKRGPQAVGCFMQLLRPKLMPPLPAGHALLPPSAKERDDKQCLASTLHSRQRSRSCRATSAATTVSAR